MKQEKYLVVVKVYSGFQENDGMESYQLQEIDMFSKWTDKRPNIEDLRSSLTVKGT
jgi:hypothetical protein